jgi:hypothetical protein
MIFRTHEELLSIPIRLGNAYMQAREAAFDGTAVASYENRHEQEAARLGKSHTEAELLAERERIG